MWKWRKQNIEHPSRVLTHAQHTCRYGQSHVSTTPSKLYWNLFASLATIGSTAFIYSHSSHFPYFESKSCCKLYLIQPPLPFCKVLKNNIWLVLCMQHQPILRLKTNAITTSYQITSMISIRPSRFRATELNGTQVGQRPTGHVCHHRHVLPGASGHSITMKWKWYEMVGNVGHYYGKSWYIYWLPRKLWYTNQVSLNGSETWVRLFMPPETGRQYTVFRPDGGVFVWLRGQVWVWWDHKIP